MVKENPADFIQSMGTKESSLNDCARFLKSQVLDSKA